MTFSHTVETDAPEEVWQRWIDVGTWHEWDTEVKKASLEGDFELGAEGTLTPKTGPETSFVVTDFVPGQSNTFTMALPLCKLHIQHASSDDKKSSTHEVCFEGLLAPLFALLLGRRFRKVLPDVMANLRELTEVQEGSSVVAL